MEWIGIRPVSSLHRIRAKPPLHDFSFTWQRPTMFTRWSRQVEIAHLATSHYWLLFVFSGGFPGKVDFWFLAHQSTVKLAFNIVHDFCFLRLARDEGDQKRWTNKRHRKPQRDATKCTTGLRRVRRGSISFHSTGLAASERRYLQVQVFFSWRFRAVRL